MKSYINKKGYVIKKKHYDNLLLEEIRKELTVKPNINEDYGTKAVPYKVYKEGKTKLYLPKFYAIKKLGKTVIKMSDGLDIDVVFKGSLRQNQEIPTQKTLMQMKNIGGGLLSLPCGFGKTCISCATSYSTTAQILHNPYKKYNEYCNGIKILSSYDSYLLLLDTHACMLYILRIIA